MEMQNLQVKDTPTNAMGNGQESPPTGTEIETWIASYLAELMEVALDEIDVKIPFDRYGLDSSAAVGLTGDLEEWLGCEIDPTVMYDYPTIESLAQHLGAALKS